MKKNVPKPNGKVPVMGRITVKRSIAQFSCKLDIAPSLWDLKSNRAAGKSLEAQKINRAIDNIWLQITGHYQRISDKDAYVLAIKIRDAWMAGREVQNPAVALYRA